jgi:hypothetical protein
MDHYTLRQQHHTTRRMEGDFIDRTIGEGAALSEDQAVVSVGECECGNLRQFTRDPNPN